MFKHPVKTKNNEAISMSIIDNNTIGPPEIFTDHEIDHVMERIASNAQTIETLCIETLSHMSTDREDWEKSIEICESLMLASMRSAQQIRWITNWYSQRLRDSNTD
ncbi:hypothetical protein CWI75_10645 [Kineobactrum sediminis]|uniref:Uncharacterized protein n=1 Tax=Kineobactrum sediminis TaxID=1905677 RepID=A0A2N5Y1E8_9GAMM|nr:hypothetical protein CWI75_10645 [Kineobactrum sediminis]